MEINEEVERQHQRSIYEQQARKDNQLFQGVEEMSRLLMNSASFNNLFGQLFTPGSNLMTVSTSLNLQPLTQPVIKPVVDTTDTKETEKSIQCSVCMENKKCALLKPCNQIGCCMSCTKTIMQNDKKCPLCRTLIESFEKVYL